MRGVCLLATVLVAISVPVASARQAANSVTFTDTTGEPDVADITTVTVSNDDNGLIALQVDIANEPALIPGMVVAVDVDSDGDAATGFGPAGIEYAFAVSATGGSFNRWNGTGFEQPATPSFSGSYANGVATFRISAKDLGGSRAFTFFAMASVGVDTSTPTTDRAPDEGQALYAYDVRIAPKLVAGKATTLPSPARHGRFVTVRLPVAISDTGDPAASPLVTCSARVATKALPARRKSFSHGVASCAFLVPATARGKTLRGTIAVTLRSVRVSRPFAVRVS